MNVLRVIAGIAGFALFAWWIAAIRNFTDDLDQVGRTKRPRK